MKPSTLSNDQSLQPFTFLVLPEMANDLFLPEHLFFKDIKTG